eukprot:3588165-Prymnesium_polylepis.1
MASRGPSCPWLAVAKRWRAPRAMGYGEPWRAVAAATSRGELWRAVASRETRDAPYIFFCMNHGTGL